LSAADTTTTVPGHGSLSRAQTIGIMFLCTLLGATAQIFIKVGANGSNVGASWTTAAGVWTNLFAMASNPHLVFGYGLYAIMTVLFVVTLRDEELSVVYPVIALTYVWVTMLSVFFFHEAVNWFKAAGVVLIVSGVAVLGKDGRK
jgi:drug/metabolite transporter (DMT)-like permease